MKKNFSDDLLYKNNVGERKFVISSGSLIRLRDYMNVGRFDEKLFIGQIDQDFCYKLHINQKKCFVVENIYMYQELGSGKTVNIIGKKIMIPNYNHIRYYYIFRNEWYLREKYGESYNKFKVELWKYLILILFEKNRMKKYYSILKAKRDYKTMFVQHIR